MGKLVPEVVCPLCSQGLDPLKPHFRASGAFLPTSDPLNRLCNASFHWECYAGWSERPRFARAFVNAWVKANRRNPFWWTAHLDADVYISVNPEPPVEEVSLRLFAVGSDVRVPLPRWTAWLAAPSAVTPQLQPLELECLAPVLALLRTKYPDDHAVVHAIDADEKSRRA